MLSRADPCDRGETDGTNSDYYWKGGEMRERFGGWGGLFYLLDVQGVLHAELRRQPVEDGVRLRGERGHLRDLGYARELLQPAALHRHPEADEAELAEDAAQPLHLGGVPPAGNIGFRRYLTLGVFNNVEGFSKLVLFRPSCITLTCRHSYPSAEGRRHKFPLCGSSHPQGCL